MIPVLLPVLLQFLPELVNSVESLSGHKAAATGQPMTGTAKLNAVTTLAMSAVQMAGIIDPKHIGQPEAQLAQDLTNAIVKYSNCKGTFAHGAAPAPPGAQNP